MDDSHKLTNEDFRKLLMTPRVSGGSTATPAAATANLTKEKLHDASVGSSEVSKAEARRRKKLLYAKIKKEEEDQMAELAKKYRDRARERRDGINPDYQGEDPTSAGGAYRAVAPDIRSNINAAERRRQQIQESKYLGGDMEHTHLVKGLDYALLQKVRTEISAKEVEENGEDLDALLEKEAATAEKMKGKEEEMQFKSKVARNIYRTVFKTHIPQKNELFLPGRMAYVMDLDEEFAESDIPTTLMRSKADIPIEKLQTTLTTNDIVINKLAQILSYLRAGGKKTKKDKTKKDKVGKVVDEKEKPVDDSIYGEIGDYVPPAPSATAQEAKSRDRDRDRRDKERPRQDTRDRRDRDRDRDRKDDRKTSSYFDDDKRDRRDEQSAVMKEADRTLGTMLKQQDGKPSKGQEKGGILSKLTSEPEGYAECYPGFEEMQDAIVDSDDEVDYTKMDAGNKKGPIGRWDFDTAEEYGDYMANKEALPKAAFQYGVKMADGRRTRKVKNEKNEKAELDREWNQIQQIIQKRKSDSSGGRSAKVPKV